MAKVKSKTREKIIAATTQLIKDFGDTSQITVRDIAEKAEVGSALINYHFQTKENLIGVCILSIISQFIEEIERLYRTLDLEPIDKLRYVFKAKCSFLVANPVLSRMSMMLDLSSAGLEDNTDQAAKVHVKVLREAFGERKTDNEELFVILHVLMSSIQNAFLRSNVFKINTGIDFFSQEQREQYIDDLVDRVLLGEVTSVPKIK